MNINLYELNYITIIVRILLAVLIGGIIGLERDMKNHPAGFRTYMLVCLGSAIIMMTNEYVSVRYMTGDPTRMGAQVVSGIGFLGAGTILVTNTNRIRGLTTAAGLWSSAALGLAIGIGFYEVAIIGGFAIFLIMTLFVPVKEYIQRHAKYMQYHIIFDSIEGFNHFLQFCANHNLYVIDIQSGEINVDENQIPYMISIRPSEQFDSWQFMQLVTNLPGIMQIEEI